LSKSASLPLYVDIKQELERRIVSGEWPTGHHVPSEHELKAQYKCSRMTVNKALSMLASAGLVVRRRRSGTFVAAPAVEETVLEIHDIKAEILNSGQSYGYALLSRKLRRATAVEAERLGLKAGDPVLKLVAQHFSAGRPYVIETRLINVLFVPEAKTTFFGDTPPGTWLLSRIPWSDAEHQIRAINASPEIAKALGVEPGAACLLVERRTWSSGNIVTHVTLNYPGDSHSLIGKFSPVKT
jgi:GntR family histidine utilization transcriptional repressor